MKNTFLLLPLLLMSLMLSGCSLFGAVYDVVTLPIVLVGEVAGGIADVVSSDDDDDDDDDDEEAAKETPVIQERIVYVESPPTGANESYNEDIEYDD